MANKSSASAESLLEMGLLALDAGNFDEALEQWNLVLEQDPDNARAQRLVSDLEQLISDNRGGTTSPASGEFFVVVEDEDEVDAVPADAAPNVISKEYLQRIQKVSEDTLADNEALSGRLATVQSELTVAKQTAGELRAQLGAAHNASAELEKQKNELETQLQDLNRFRRQHERVAAELDLRLAERKASERQLLADIEKAAAERDSVKSDLESANERITKLEADLAEQTAEGRRGEAAQEKLKEELEETRNALASERATLEDVRGERETQAAAAAELEKQVADGKSALDTANAEIEKLRADQDAVTTMRDELQKAKDELEAQLAEANERAAQNAEENTCLAAELAKAAAEAEERVGAATNALEESQTARTAMRTEMATIVQDLEAAKAKSAELEAELKIIKAATEDATSTANAKAEAAEKQAMEAATKAADLELSAQETSEALESATATVAELQQRINDQDDAFTELQAQLMARDVSIAELQSQLETRNQAHAAQQSASSLGAAELESKVADLEVLTQSQTAQLQAKDVMLEELQGQLQLAQRDQGSATLQAEVDRLKVQLSAADGRARSATEEVELLEQQVELLKAAPIDMHISGPDLGVEREATTTEAISIGGQFEATEAAAAQEDNESSTLDLSAVNRLRDEALSPAERLSWLIDEQPYVANTASVPDLSAQAAFVLQNIDGSVSFADLIDIVGLPADETYTILLDLWDRGVITSPSLEP